MTHPQKKSDGEDGEKADRVLDPLKPLLPEATISGCGKKSQIMNFQREPNLAIGP